MELIKKKRGFACMDRARHLEIARKGGANVPNHRRSFAQNPALATEAGRKGGQNVKSEERTFAKDRTLAASAGRKGGQRSQRKRASRMTSAE